MIDKSIFEYYWVFGAVQQNSNKKINRFFSFGVVLKTTRENINWYLAIGYYCWNYATFVRNCALRFQNYKALFSYIQFVRFTLCSSNCLFSLPLYFHLLYVYNIYMWFTYANWQMCPRQTSIYKLQISFAKFTNYHVSFNRFSFFFFFHFLNNFCFFFFCICIWPKHSSLFLISY